MPLNTLTVSGAVVPTVIATYFSHYIHKKDLVYKPTEHISYHEGLRLIRRFLLYASNYTVEEVQAFTSRWVPIPRWVKVEEVTIPPQQISESAEAIQHQFGERGIEKVGGRTWWQWREEGSQLKAEWIEMRRHYNERSKTGEDCKRVMLYVHGGAYFFGSVDEHRYQMQRHARKLQARVFARMLVTIRDRGIALPAGAILISPWCDLTHSFPSVCGDHSLDFIPTYGFLQKPSLSWPPPNADELAALSTTNTGLSGSAKKLQAPKLQQGTQGTAIGETSDVGRTTHPRQRTPSDSTPAATSATLGHGISVMIDGSMVHIKDQIQMYTTNELLSHPLVSPVLQPSLGGLPPLLVLTGGGEVLRDEQIYLAHKAANPTKYPPGDGYLDEDPVARETLAKWKPTNVQLQVWDNCCHATPALSFTHPAKHMYRSIAQFAAWALARAQKTEIEILDDDDVSIASSSSSFSERRSSNRKRPAATSPQAPTARVGRAGDPLPPFHNHMVRQRVGRHGVIYDLDPESDLPVLKIPPSEVGAVKPEPVRRWMEGKKMKDKQFASVRREIQKQRAREIATGFGVLGENPPPSALAGRRKKGLAKDTKRRKSLGMSLWSMWGSSYDGKILQREEKGDKEPEIAVVTSPGGTHARGTGARRSRSRSRRRTVSDTGQAGGDVGEGNDAVAGLSARRESHNSDYLGPPIAPIITITEYSETHPEQGSNQNIGAGRRPFEGPVAYPFKLAYRQGSDMNASTVTLTSEAGVLDPQFDKDDVEATGSEQIP